MMGNTGQSLETRCAIAHRMDVWVLAALQQPIMGYKTCAISDEQGFVSMTVEQSCEGCRTTQRVRGDTRGKRRGMATCNITLHNRICFALSPSRRGQNIEVCSIRPYHPGDYMTRQREFMEFPPLEGGAARQRMAIGST